ncbi:RHH-type rel operon transcriptional repressor/antitoxin RelB [Arthrobacter silviterrae]|uniref:Relaxosome protein TraY n=1 Tax=Arthrobacter silviterrae TaxID=2026658 RepID=A0ABX0DA36_9MICC|nr:MULTISPECIES: TraY domain-containing protein [Arthrobacter]MCU6481633.1 TraY domain-containing protein [Arthrobacter sp. A2-55]MDQ0277221.1 RHH-type rel operon transcriptional repressor/antitoxin RelB [Arthrobacter silviterrae]NGN83774.1 TraY domain-containing protein [Arthrobacter silviterrae]
MSQLNVRLDTETKARLEALARRTGRSRTFYATEAIVLFLDEYEDYFLAKDALEEFTQSNDESVDLADVEWPV